MNEMFMIFVLATLVPYMYYVIRKTIKAVHMLQLNSYYYGRYYRWMKGHIEVLLPLKEIVLFLILGAISMLIQNNIVVMVVFVIVYGFLALTIKKEITKKPLVYTARIKRLFTTLGILFTLILVLSMTKEVKMAENVGMFYGKLTMVTLLIYPIVFLANIINYPVERLVFYRYIYDAKFKLKKMSNLKVIGITGSYGKTSSKNILNTIIGSRLYTLPTPKSFNTPMGLTRTIREDLKPIHEAFIAEMGAYKIGDIKELCNLVQPEYAIITSIGPQHLETFGSIENVQKGKFELVESLPSHGVAVLNKDDELIRTYTISNNCKVKWYGLEHTDVDVYGYDISVSHKGTTFKVKIKGDDTVYEMDTRLLGKHNVYNILASITLGLELGLSMKELKQGVKYVEPVEHRLQIKKNGDIIYIDDAFNSNPVGSKMALEVLKEMPGKKVIVTPGMIELGEKQYELNKQFGKYIADACDVAILVGPKQTQPIQDGLKEMKYPKNQLFVVKNIQEAFTKVNQVKDGVTYVLLENDLPDSFNE